MSERIDVAAIRVLGVVHTTPRPGRHHTILHKLVGAGMIEAHAGEQGFVTTTGRFVGRHEAMEIARAAGQLIAEPPHGIGLFSEDLW